MANPYQLDFSQGFGPASRQLQNTPDPTQQPGAEFSDIYSPDTQARMTEFGIQLDEQGMADAFYDSVGALREYAIQMDMSGLDVVEGYDFRNPLAREANSIYRTAVAQHNENAARLIEGARNMQYFRDQVSQGNMIGNIDAISGGGPLTTRKLMENSFSTNLQDIDRYNQVIRGQRPTSQAEYDELVRYREEAATEILARMNFQGSPDEATLFLERHLAMPQHYDPLDDELKKAQTARTWQQYRSQKAEESYVDPIAGELVDIFSDWKQRAGATGVPYANPSEFQSDRMKGRGYQGKDEFILDNMTINESGEGVMTFAVNPDKIKQGQQDIMDQILIQALKDDGIEVNAPAGNGLEGAEIKVRFSETNAEPLIRSMMSPTEARQFFMNARRAGVYNNDGRFSMGDMEEFIGPNNEKTRLNKKNAQGKKTPQELDLSPFTSAGGGGSKSSGKTTFGL